MNPERGQILQTDDGQHIWFNENTGCYEFVSIQSGSSTSPLVEPSTSESSINSNQVAASGTAEGRVKWTMAQTLLLIEECEKWRSQLKDSKSRKIEIFKTIALQMKTHGVTFSAEQLMNRMKVLLGKYKEVKDHNATSGNSRKDWEYLDIMEKYTGDGPNITPVAKCSSLGNNIINSIESENKNPKYAQKQSGQDNPGKKRIRNNPRNDLVKVLKEYKDDVKEREEKRLKLIQDQHNETKQMFGELISLIKEKKSN